MIRLATLLPQVINVGGDNMATTLTALFTNIANAIRAKTGDSEQIVAENFPTAIANISSIKEGHVYGVTESSNTVTLADAAGSKNVRANVTVTSGVIQANSVLSLSYDGLNIGCTYCKADMTAGRISQGQSEGFVWNESTGVVTIPSPYKFINGTISYTYA